MLMLPLTHLSARRSGALATIALLGASAVIFPAAQRADAADWVVTTAAEYLQAITDARSNGEPDTITLGADISLDEEEIPAYSEDQDLTIDGAGFTITAAPTHGAPVFYAYDSVNGDQIDATITIRDLTVSGIPAPATPVVVYADELVIQGSTFENNGEAGALRARVTTVLSVHESIFRNNSSPDTGGAIYMYSLGGDPSVEFSHVSFIDNASGSDGGAAFLGSDGDISLEDVTATGNSSAGGSGGALFGYGDVEVWHSDFTDNTAGSDGGALSTDGSVVVSRSLFTNNSAAAEGGAIAAGDYADAYESTFVGNSADRGGAIHSWAFDISYISQSTFTENSATDGGAMYFAEDDVEVGLSTFVNNTATGSAPQVYVSGDLYSLGSVFSGGGCSVGDFGYSGLNVDEDGTCSDSDDELNNVRGTPALMGPLRDNGGPTPTMAPALNSPAVDHVVSYACSVALEEGWSEGLGGDGPPELGPQALGQGDPAATALAAEADGVEGWPEYHDQRGVDREDLVVSQGGECDAGSVELVKDIAFDVEVPSGTATVTVSGAITEEDDDSCEPSSLTVAEAGGSAPAGVAFPHGALGFCLRLPLAGDTVEITVDLPSPANQLWKTRSDADWVQVSEAAFSNGGTTVTYSITDNDSLDDDSTDAVIADPAAPGVGAVFTG